MSKKEVAKKESNVPAKVDFKFMGASERIDSEDIRISKMWLMQPMSKMVQEEKARVGEYRDSISGDKLGFRTQEPVEVFIFEKDKLWHEIDAHTNKYLRSVPYYGNEHLDKKGGTDKDGNEVNRDMVIRYFVLKASDVEEAVKTDNPSKAFPFALDFKRTSRETGTMLETNFAKTRGEFPSYAYSYKITATEESNDKGTYWVKRAEQGRFITQPECLLVEEWIKTLQKKKDSGNVSVDDSDDKEGAATGNVDTGSAPNNF